MVAITPALEARLRENVEELSRIEGSLLSASLGRETKCILVTSCHAREGKTIAALSLAYGLATLSNARVLLIDANLRDPKLHSLIRVPEKPGLSDLVLLAEKQGNAIHATPHRQLYILPRGASVPNPPDVLRAAQFRPLLEDLKRQFEYVIFDSQALLESSSASFLAQLLDGVVVVVECERTRWEVLKAVADKTEKSGGNLLGVVLNKRKYYIPKSIYDKL